MAQVELDAVSGSVRVLRLHVAYEVGRAIDRGLVEAQLIGGAAQGLGGALLEEFRFDARGEPAATTLVAYPLPTAVDVPQITTTVSETVSIAGNPLGAMGAGEGGITACPAAIASAVDDALGRPGAIREIPITLERVRSLCGVRQAPPAADFEHGAQAHHGWSTPDSGTAPVMPVGEEPAVVGGDRP
jgi:carbon-monoxide dehydrogenase large subunit/6-hydroxypseudooxynicotine dehydrogenase subunit gamma